MHIYELLINRAVERIELTLERCGVTLSIWKELILDETKRKRDEVTSLKVKFNQRSKAQGGRKNQVVKLLDTPLNSHKIIIFDQPLGYELKGGYVRRVECVCQLGYSQSLCDPRFAEQIQLGRRTN